MNRKHLLAVLFVSGSWCTGAQGTPKVWGAGVEGCFTYNKVFTDYQAKGEYGSRFYPRYREWLLGMVSGLSASTGLDMLYAVEPDGAMKRIHQICGEQPSSDFFSATMTMFSQMSIPGAADGQFAPTAKPHSVKPDSSITEIQPTIENMLTARNGQVPVEPTVRPLENHVPEQHLPGETDVGSNRTPEDIKQEPSSESRDPNLDIATHSLGVNPANCDPSSGASAAGASSIAVNADCP